MIVHVVEIMEQLKVIDNAQLDNAGGSSIFTFWNLYKYLLFDIFFTRLLRKHLEPNNIDFNDYVRIIP